MENVSLKALMKNTVSQEIKTKPKESQDNSFTKVINNQLSKAEDKTPTDKPQVISQDAGEPKLENDGTEKTVEAEKPEILETAEQQLMQLMQMLSGLGSEANAQQLGKLKQMITDLLKDGMAGESNPIKIKAATLDLSMLGFQGIGTGEAPGSEEVTSQITDKLITDLDFKEKFMDKLAKGLELVDADESSAFKQAVVKTLTEAIKNQTKPGFEKDMQQPDFKAIDDFTASIEPKNVDMVNTETVNSTVESTQKIIEDKAPSKEDMVLKNLLSDSDSKSSKDTVSDKIANVVTRFEAVRVDKPVATESPVTINRSSFNMDFIKAVKFMDTNNLKELSVKILPKDLGEIVIRLSMDNGVMKANITAANKETYNLLNSQLPAISNQLSEQNMSIQSFNVSLYNGDNFLFNGNGGSQGDGRQQGKRGSQVTAIEGDESLTQSYEIEDSNINALA